MKTKHTPGPWRIGKNYGAIVSDSEEGLGLPGACGPGAVEAYGGYLVCESVALANAEVIAAAPDLLRLLRMLVPIAEDLHGWGPATCDGCAAVRDARELLGRLS